MKPMNEKVFAILNELTAAHSDISRKIAASGFRNIGPFVTRQVEATIAAEKAIASVYAAMESEQRKNMPQAAVDLNGAGEPVKSEMHTFPNGRYSTI